MLCLVQLCATQDLTVKTAGHRSVHMLLCCSTLLLTLSCNSITISTADSCLVGVFVYSSALFADLLHQQHVQV